MVGISGIVFDLGNTLAPFGADHHRRLRRRLAETLSHELHSIATSRIHRAVADADRELTRIREQTLIESDPLDWARLTVESLGSAATAPLLEAARHCLHETFVELLRVEPRTMAILARLAESYPLGLLSNYWMADAVRAVLDRDGVTPHFRATLVSAELGVVKPHPRLFEEISRRLALPAAELLFVGDNRRADIAGAASAGMTTVLTKEYQDGADERDRAAGVTRRPDHVIGRLEEVERLLASS